MSTRRRKRKKTPTAREAEILVQSRRRCCVCFSLHHDEDVKKGQLAHLDGDASNDAYDNLAFLCFNHHDEYDSRTSQSKNLTVDEVKKYREELYIHFESWKITLSHKHLLNFLASTIDNQAIADAAIKIPGVFYQEILSFEVLLRKGMTSCDEDTYIPYLITLDHLSLWGLLTFEEEEFEDEDKCPNVKITVQHRPICKEIASLIKKRVLENGNQKYIDWIESLDKKI